MIKSSTQAARDGGERETASAAQADFPSATKTDTALTFFARRLGLAFWGYEIDEGDFIVVHPGTLGCPGDPR